MRKRKLIFAFLIVNITISFAQNVDLNNNTDYIRIQKNGESGFSRAFGLNPSNHMYIGSLEKPIGNMYFYNKGPGALMTLASTGNVGIGTTGPTSKLYVLKTNEDGVISKNAINSVLKTKTTSNVTSYDKATYSSLISYNIPSGIIDNGYKIGLDASAYSGGDVFEGTLRNNFGVWARAGIYKAAPGARIKEAIAVNAQVLSNAPGTFIDGAYGIKIDTGSSNETQITNKWDLYAGTATAKNYFAGNVGIGTTKPKSLLDVGKNIPNEVTGAILGRLSEGTSTGDGTYIGIKGYGTQSNQYDGKGFALVHNFYGQTNSSVNFFRGGSTTGGFLTFNTNNNAEQMRIDKDGNVGIGTKIPDSGYKLTVKGKVSAREVRVTATAGGADFVFADNYELPKLESVEAFIKANKYLPEIPSAKEMDENGIHLAEMNIKLLQKIEELTLYTIQQEKDIRSLQEKEIENKSLKERMIKLESLVSRILEEK